MAYKNLQEFIQRLEQEGELIRIKEYVNPHLEITEIVDRISKHNGPALLFENTGYQFPLLINALGSEKRMCLALGVEKLDDIAAEIESLFKTIATPKDSITDKLKLLPQLGKIASWMPKMRKGKGDCQEVINKNPDITQLPVMTCWPEDGGPFLTLPVINTMDPETKIRNVGMYRMQVLGPTLTGMHWHKHKVSAGHFNSYKRLGKKMPVAVILGGDPAYTYAATAPLPPNVDEYVLAGFLRKKKVDLIKCITQDMYVPSDADFVIEGFVDPEEDLIWEGPFGDHTGYYSLADWYPKFHITCITHRKNAVYPSTIVGIPPQEDAWIGKATERIFIAPIKMTMLPEMLDMDMPIEGVFHNLTTVRIKKEFSGHGQKVMNAMWGAGQMMFNKILIIADENTTIQNYKELARSVSNYTDPAQDIYISQGPMDVLDHSCSKFAFGGKMCIDATLKSEEEKNDLAKNIVISEIQIDTEKLMQKYPEIHSININLILENISLVLISIEKNRLHHVGELSEKLFSESGMYAIKFLVITDKVVNSADIDVVTWHAANNIDPKRDIYIFKHGVNGISHAAIDGTRKTKQFDNFNRDWPNIICMDDDTIKAVDAKWDKLGLGAFISSPSLRYRNQYLKGGAIVEQN
ncbi:MAG: menaquinone biosynthesis decarboxylase [Bacteroidetes bacterium]|nr:menaquinone biosynthesis decarboxylase [Bacteroidota bacterium]